MGIIKFYSESIEQDIKSSLETKSKDKDFVDMIESWTIDRNDFIILFGIDGILCIIVLVAISQFFTKNLTNRIKENDLGQKIEYKGDIEIEFENVCNAFNVMQTSILNEQEKKSEI